MRNGNIEGVAAEVLQLVAQHGGDRAALMSAHISGLLADSTLIEAALRGGVAPIAISSIRIIADKTWKVVDGRLLPFAENGDIIYGASGVSPMTPDEWIDRLRTDHDYLFQERYGGRPQGWRA